MTWNDGYVSEINYTYGFYSELSPLRLGLATQLKSIQPPSSQSTFNYCELACGRGYTTNLLAATYPQAQFYANDFNPSHILDARTLAEKAGTKNVQFFDDSFEEFLNRDLPSFDFICLHGIYSWISPKNRQAIINFIRQNLTVGGVVYISYNALPGWAAARPMQALMRRYGGQSSAPILTRIDQALQFTGQLLEANAAYFVQNPILKNRFEKLKEQNRQYLAHEYFNQEWNAFYFDDVVQELEAAKLNFVGSAHFPDYVDAVNLSAAAQSQLAQIADPIFREVVRDFFINTQFRRDIFIRGNLALTPQEQTQCLLETRFTLIVALKSVTLKHQFVLGEVELQEAIYQPICSVLAQGVFSLRELQQHPDTQQIPLSSLYQALVLLIGLGYVHPAVSDTLRKQRQKSTDAFNLAIKNLAVTREEMLYLASPLVGTGIAVNRIDQLFLLAKHRKQEPCQFVWQVLVAQGKKLLKEGQVLETEAENLALIQTNLQEFEQERLPIFNRLGIS